MPVRLLLGVSVVVSTTTSQANQPDLLTPFPTDILSRSFDFLDLRSVVNGVTASSSLRGAANISVKHLVFNYNFDSWDSLPLFTSLESLTLNAIPLTPAALESLGKLTSLRTLKICTDTPFDISFLERLPNLENLQISASSLPLHQPPLNLRNLKSLKITESGPTVRIVSLVNGCPNLEVLDIDFQIPSSSRLNLQRLVHLRELRLKYWCSRAPDALEILTQLPELRRLDLTVNTKTNLNFLRRMTNLEILRLASAKRIVEFDVEIVQNLPHLRHLDIETIEPVNVHFLGTMTALQELNVNLSTAGGVNDGSFLGSMVNLKTLEVRWLPHTKVLRNLLKLNKLTLKNAGVVDFRVFQFHSRLRSLEIEAAEIWNFDLREIGKMIDLKYFRLSHKVTAADGERMSLDLAPLNGLVNLTEISIDNFKFDSLQPLRNSKALKFLKLWNCEFYDLSPVGQLPKLETIIITGSTIKDISGLNELTSLQVLELGTNSRVTEFGNVRNLPNLHAFN